MKDIKYFRVSQKPYVDESHLLDGGVGVEQNVFPIETENGLVMVAVKKQNVIT